MGQVMAFFERSAWTAFTLAPFSPETKASGAHFRLGGEGLGMRGCAAQCVYQLPLRFGVARQSHPAAPRSPVRAQPGTPARPSADRDADHAFGRPRTDDADHRPQRSASQYAACRHRKACNDLRHDARVAADRRSMHESASAQMGGSSRFLSELARVLSKPGWTERRS